jgi:hypothetical protein
MLMVVGPGVLGMLIMPGGWANIWAGGGDKCCSGGLAACLASRASRVEQKSTVGFCNANMALQ